MREVPAELQVLFRRFEPLPDRIDRNRKRLRSFLMLYVALSSFLVAFALVAGVYLTLALIAIRLRNQAMFVALVWFTPRIPSLVAGVWICCVPLFAIWCVVTLRRGESGVLASLGAVPAPTGAYRPVKSALHDVSLASGLALPRLVILDDPAVNAFVVTHKSECGWIGVTTGLVDRLDADELRCVLGHLMARIQDGSALTSTILAELFAAASTASGIGDQFLAMCGEDPDDGVVEILGKSVAAPLALLYAVTRGCLSLSALFIRSGYRKHQAITAEYADSMGMLLTKDPRGMVGALEKVLPADNRPGSVWEPRLEEDIFGALFFAWPTFSFDDDPELVRIRRLREVLGPAAAQ